VVDNMIGNAQSGIKKLASMEKISNAKKMTAEYAFSVVVKDSDGYTAEYYYPFDMEYLGFD